MEKKDGLDKQRIRDIETQSADPSGAGAICLPDRSEELSLNSKDEAALALKTRTASLYFATLLGIAILGFDMYLTHTTGHGYKSPDWAVAIITATYLGASGNQLAGLLKIFRRK